MFKLPMLAALVCLLAGPALAQDDERGQRLLDSQLKSMPADVVAFADREFSCRRLSTLEITNQATDDSSQHALIHHQCDTLIIDVAALRLKYARSPVELRVLDATGGVGL
jgi:hypothetical protein